MTTFFKLLKENNSVAKTLVTLIQNMGDYDISEKDIESAMKHIRLSDLLSLNDAVEERDMGTIMDILEPFIPGILPQTNEKLSPTHRMGSGSTVGAMQPTGTRRPPVERPGQDPTTVGWNKDGQIQVPGGLKTGTGGGGGPIIDPNDIPSTKAGDPTALGKLATMTTTTDEQLPVPKSVERQIAALMKRAGVAGTA